MITHKYYPNLAHLETFDRDLDYSGIPLEGWTHPICFIPPILLAIALLTAGFPRRGIVSFWVLFNFVIIHPMDFFVGTLGYGPKYLVDEYAVLDSRYWVLQDPCVTVISILEIVVMAPMCYLWYRALVQQSWSAPYWATLTSTWQLFGALLYVGGEYLDNFQHLPGNDFTFPPKFDSYLKLKYFWGIFVFANCVWVLLPILIMVGAYRELSSAANSKIHTS